MKSYLLSVMLLVSFALGACGDMQKELEVVVDENPILIGDVSYETAPDSAGMDVLTSVEFVETLGVGWNLGNALDALDTTTGERSETLWGNPIISESLVQSVANAGFDTVRLPVAWSDFSDDASFTISQERMQRVQDVVDLILAADMKVMLNLHWDGGWMQPTYEEKDYVNNRLAIMWRQIARNFRDYDARLMFAGSNEVMVEGDYSTPSEEYYSSQNSFNQTFVEAVRSTGGKNAFRYLVVQGFNTNIDHTVNFLMIPNDSVDNRLLVEVHFYDPYEFTLDASSSATQWGEGANNQAKAQWPSDERHVDGQFKKMHDEFVANGIGVVLGEYGVEARDGDPQFESFRSLWLAYVTNAALNNGMAPMVWDNGYESGMGLFNRTNGQQTRPELIKVLSSGRD